MWRGGGKSDPPLVKISFTIGANVEKSRLRPSKILLLPLRTANWSKNSQKSYFQKAFRQNKRHTLSINSKFRLIMTQKVAKVNVKNLQENF